MGNTTIIELNHDQGHEIEKYPDEFLREIREQLASFAHNGERIMGGQVIAGFHRSGTIDRLWDEFKRRLHDCRKTAKAILP